MPSVKYKILLAEDKIEERKLLAEYLHGKDYELFLAPDGKAALEVAKKVQPDLILLDINMPKMNGYTVLQYLATIPNLAQIPVIFISAAVTPEERVKGLKEGATDYIVKPYEPEEVLLRIKMHLHNSKNKLFPKIQNEDSDSYTARLDRALFNAACSKFFNDLAITPVLDDLSRELRTNTKRLNQAFKSCSGKTPFNYLRDVRMLEAKRLLRESLYDIGTISAKIGFKSPANFSTAFKKVFNTSPKNFRNNEK